MSLSKIAAWHSGSERGVLLWLTRSEMSVTARLGRGTELHLFSELMVLVFQGDGLVYQLLDGLKSVRHQLIVEWSDQSFQE